MWRLNSIGGGRALLSFPRDTLGGDGGGGGGGDVKLSREPNIVSRVCVHRRVVSLYHARDTTKHKRTRYLRRLSRKREKEIGARARQVCSSPQSSPSVSSFVISQSSGVAERINSRVCLVAFATLRFLADCILYRDFIASYRARRQYIVANIQKFRDIRYRRSSRARATGNSGETFSSFSNRVPGYQRFGIRA